MALNRVGSCSTPRLIQAGLGLIGVCIAGYILGPPLYWHFMEGLAAVNHSSSSCPPCLCDCSSLPLLSIAEGLGNATFGDCAKHDGEVINENDKTFAELLVEELKLRETEASERQKHADMALLEAKKITSQYQKEADKCNSGMETCEGAREKSEGALAAQKRMTALWELRARQKGWREAKSNSQAHADVQTA